MQIKAADDRQPDVVALKRLLDRPGVPVTTRKRIEAKIRTIRAGEQGERDAAYEIELWFGRSPNWATIHDLRIDHDGLVAQFDHLIINRLAEIWVCESKHFAEGVSVNEHGEWVRWWHGRSEGIRSPIEQNHRHVFLLERVFDDRLVAVPRGLGLVPMKPSLRSLVLVSNNAKIGRPKRAVKGVDEVIKAEQLKSTLFNAFDASPIANMRRLIGKEGLAAFAKALAALHHPVVVDWAARFGLATESASPALAPTRTTVRDELRSGPAGASSGGGECARCGRSVSEAVRRYCDEHVADLGGAVYCMRCQPIVRARAEQPQPRPDWQVVLARYGTPTRLRTVARQAPFIVVASGADLRVMPDSSGRGRTLTRADFERAAPLLSRSSRGEVNQASRNSSYVEAILADFRT